MDIKFKYSHIYEVNLNPTAEPIPIEIIKRKIEIIGDFWKEKGPQIEETLKEITGLSFREKETICWLNSKRSFSDPLTLAMVANPAMKDNLVHELIHVLLTQNDIGSTQKWKAMFDLLKQWSFPTKVHVIIHAVHFVLAQKLFPERVEYIRTFSVDEAYKKSWELVEEMGAQNIIDSVFK